MSKRPLPPHVVDKHVTDLHLLNDRLTRAKNGGQGEDVSAASDQMTAAVEAARNAGVSWASIGTALDIARGNAYKRFYKKRSQLTAQA